ncbi:MAG: LLM class flavin-dependent oxidoreductase [Alphaproteobacteria bacterium]|nr:LLM class flavin-dependent oxidoreductase [Alphaproteobacteria bacterium]
MTVELLLLGNVPIADMVERARLAEASGYDTVWLADERFYREVYSCLAMFAARTEMIRLGPCVTDPYARHPALTAMAIATLDEISGGRAILGIGAGISGFAELGIERRKPARAIREAIELIRALLTGEPVDYQGEVVGFRGGKLSFSPPRREVPIYVASNGPLGQRMAGAVADGALMEGCGSAPEARAFAAEIAAGAARAGRDPGRVKLAARLNVCIAADGKAARDTLRPAVARYLGAGRLKFHTDEAQGLALPADALAGVADAPYASGYTPYLPLLPLISDAHVAAHVLAGTVEEVTAQVVALRRAGIDSIIVMPFAAPGGNAEDTLVAFGTEVWPGATRALGGGIPA